MPVRRRLSTGFANGGARAECPDHWRNRSASLRRHRKGTGQRWRSYQRRSSQSQSPLVSHRHWWRKTGLSPEHGLTIHSQTMSALPGYRPRQRSPGFRLPYHHSSRPEVFSPEKIFGTCAWFPFNLHCTGIAGHMAVRRCPVFLATPRTLRFRAPVDAKDREASKIACIPPHGGPIWNWFDLWPQPTATGMKSRRVAA